MATLLLADDSLTTQKVVNLTFADEGIEVITADDGDTALQLFHERRPDVVLADVNIPGLNGYEVCEAIRKTNDSQKTPVVLLVGSFEPFDAHEAHRVGANDYLTKPFSSIRRLVATVLAFLDESPSVAERGPVDEIEEITVEPAFSAPETSESEETSFEQAAEAHEAREAETHGAESVSTEADSEILEVPEPDMYSTNDIEDLYTQSFAETVEMPHTVAERARFNDGSADDELIETTYTDQPQQGLDTQQEGQRVTEEILQPIAPIESAAFETPEGQEGEHPQVSYETTKLPAPDFVTESVVERFESPVQHPVAPIEEPAGGVNHDAFEAVQEVRPQDAPTEEYNFEYRSEETYFEPTAEPAAENTEGVETFSAFSEGDEQAQILRQTDPGPQHYAEAAPETTARQTDELAPTASPTPWDSVAPIDREFRLDESNLLELPANSSGYSANNLEREAAEPHPNETVSADTVERIARVVASQMSEQLIREIAERVVPKVVEETLARRAREEVNG